jgi:hypothetical protein
MKYGPNSRMNIWTIFCEKRWFVNLTPGHQISGWPAYRDGRGAAGQRSGPAAEVPVAAQHPPVQADAASPHICQGCDADDAADARVRGADRVTFQQRQLGDAVDTADARIRDADRVASQQSKLGDAYSDGLGDVLRQAQSCQLPQLQWTAKKPSYLACSLSF